MHVIRRLQTFLQILVAKPFCHTIIFLLWNIAINFEKSQNYLLNIKARYIFTVLKFAVYVQRTKSRLNFVNFAKCAIKASNLFVLLDIKIDLHLFASL